MASLTQIAPDFEFQYVLKITIRSTKRLHKGLYKVSDVIGVCTRAKVVTNAAQMLEFLKRNSLVLSKYKPSDAAFSNTQV